MKGGIRLVLGMLLVQAIVTGLQLLSKLILDQGTFIFAIMTYRHIVATFCIAPFALFFERESLKKLNLYILIWLFLTALSGISMATGFFYFGLRDTTATYATNFLNLIPIVTFVFSIIFRVEKLRWNTKHGRVKLTGAILCLAGALIIVLYKGKLFHLSNIRFKNQKVVAQQQLDWKRGTMFLTLSCLSYGFWLIAQAKLFKIFPHTYTATTIICIIAMLQSMVIGLCIDRRKASWKLGWNLTLITIFYSGALATTATFCLVSWAIVKIGPTYPSMFNPLSLILVAIIEAVFLGASVSTGSLIGMAFIIMGLYLFLWGKNMEMKSLVQPEKEKSSSQLMADEAAVLQSTAVVIPSFSPNDHCTTVVGPAPSSCVDIQSDRV